MSLIDRTIATRVLLGILLSSIALSCKDYEYSSPLPGILEVRLAVKNTRSSIIPFTKFSQFNIIVKDFFVDRDDGANLELFADLRAIRRKDKGDSLNCLSFGGRDSQLILGTAYAPPGKYVSPVSNLSTAITHDPFVFRFDGISFSVIDVLDHFSVPQKITFTSNPPTFEVKEGVRTVVNITLDLDASLVRRTEVFEWFSPLVYVSSIQYN